MRSEPSGTDPEKTVGHPAPALPGYLPQPAATPGHPGQAAPGYPPPAVPGYPAQVTTGYSFQAAGLGYPAYPAPGAGGWHWRRWLHGRAWLLLLLGPFGWTTWAAFLYVGIRARRPWWLAWAAVYASMIVAAFILDLPANAGSTTSGGVGVILELLAWVGGGVHALAISGSAVRRIDDRADPTIKAARQRIERRAEGRRLLFREPQLAREAGLGRPDITGADDYGLVDVNHATEPGLRLLPGVTEDTVRQIVQVRAVTGGFSSVEDLAVAVLLPASMVEQLRDVAVFVP